jgi:hypothetical protein
MHLIGAHDTAVDPDDLTASPEFQVQIVDTKRLHALHHASSRTPVTPFTILLTVLTLAGKQPDLSGFYLLPHGSSSTYPGSVHSPFARCRVAAHGAHGALSIKSLSP